MRLLGPVSYVSLASASRSALLRIVIRAFFFLVAGSPRSLRASRSSLMRFSMSVGILTSKALKACSYGMNNWVQNAAPGTTPYPGCPAKLHWKQLNVRQTDKIPMMGDAWFSGFFPRNSSEPPPLREGIPNRGGTGHIRIFCVDSHNGDINMVFLKGSARKVKLKELWTFKWARDSKTNLPPPNWDSEAPWMVKMKDYSR